MKYTRIILPAIAVVIINALIVSIMHEPTVKMFNISQFLFFCFILSTISFTASIGAFVGTQAAVDELTQRKR